MTVYRRFPDVTALLQSLMTREFLAVIDDVASTPPAAGANARERFAATVADGAFRLSEHPLFQRVLDVDPDLLHPLCRPALRRLPEGRPRHLRPAS